MRKVGIFNHVMPRKFFERIGDKRRTSSRGSTPTEVAANVSWQNYERSWNLWKTRALAKLAAEKS